MTVDAAHMRIVSLEILFALVAFVVFASRIRTRAVEDTAFTPLRAELEVTENGTVRRIQSMLPLVVGRSSQVDVPVLDPLVSRRHARLDVEDGIIYVTDLNSSNGTYLNGRRVEDSIELRPGDSIGVGAANVTFVGTNSSWT